MCRWSDVAPEAQGVPLLSAGRGSLPPGGAGGAEGVPLRGGLWDRGERGHREPDPHGRETPEPRTQEPLGHTAQPGPAVSAAAARSQVSQAHAHTHRDIETQKNTGTDLFSYTDIQYCFMRQFHVQM